MAQLRRLNRWTEDQAENDLIRSESRCIYLDRFEWDLDLSVLRGQLTVAGYPDLYIPKGRSKGPGHLSWAADVDGQGCRRTGRFVRPRITKLLRHSGSAPGARSRSG